MADLAHACALVSRALHRFVCVLRGEHTWSMTVFPPGTVFGEGVQYCQCCDKARMVALGGRT